MSPPVLSTDSVIQFPPNRARKREQNNPGTWPQEIRESIVKQVSPAIDHHRTLAAIEHAIQALDLVRIGRKIEPDELSTTIKELRAVRVEHLKEIG